jgi:hypothetical protein
MMALMKLDPVLQELPVSSSSTIIETHANGMRKPRSLAGTRGQKARTITIAAVSNKSTTVVRGIFILWFSVSV